MNYQANGPVIYHCSDTEAGRSVWAYYGTSYDNGCSRSARSRRTCRFGGADSPASTVARRNERERKRVRLVNLGFAALRQHVPYRTRTKRASKVETLRSAILYIKQLQRLLAEHDISCRNSQVSNTSTPFSTFLNPIDRYSNQEVHTQQTELTSSNYYASPNEVHNQKLSM